MKPAHTLTFAIVMLAGCADDPYGESTQNICDAASDALASCGGTFEQSLFGTCQPAQRAQANELLELYRDDGCAAISGVKADSAACSKLPFLCVQHTVSELAPFTTDGCSMFPDGTVANATRWLECCVAHDYAYYVGGPEQAREAADRELQRCIQSKTNQALADLMYFGVRLGGTPALPTPWRWGYGWTYDPLDGYRELPIDQARAAEQRVSAHRAHPVPPMAFEQRVRALADTIASVPQLTRLIEQVKALVGKLE
jgi:hypothetical protein